MMSTLANHAFTKMNGLGNEIVVVDMRQEKGAISAAEARAAAQPAGAPYDQLMALHAPRTAGTDGYVRIYNSDGSEAGACGNGMRCVAELMFGDRQARVDLRDQGWPPQLLAGRYRADLDRGYGPAALGLERDPAGRFRDTRAIELQVGPIDQPILPPPSAVSMGNPHAIFWVDDVTPSTSARSGRCSSTIRCSRSAPTSRWRR
jgi:diaminopimelate epimerase